MSMSASCDPEACGGCSRGSNPSSSSSSFSPSNPFSSSSSSFKKGSESWVASVLRGVRSAAANGSTLPSSTSGSRAASPPCSVASSLGRSAAAPTAPTPLGWLSSGTSITRNSADRALLIGGLAASGRGCSCWTPLLWPLPWPLPWCPLPSVRAIFAGRPSASGPARLFTTSPGAASPYSWLWPLPLLLPFAPMISIAFFGPPLEFTHWRNSLYSASLPLPLPLPLSSTAIFAVPFVG